MKNHFITLLLSLVSLTCSAITKSEFQDLIGSQTKFLSIIGYIELNKDGTGMYSSDITEGTGLHELLSLLGTVEIECDGAVAKCRYNCKIKLKWQIVNGKVVIKYTNIQGNTQAEIASWEIEPYAASTVDCIKQKLRKRLADDKNKVGRSITYVIVKNEKGQIGLQMPELGEPYAALSTFWAYDSTSDASSTSSSSSYSPETHESQYTDASYPNGSNGINKFVHQYLKYPNSVQKDGINTSVYFKLEIGDNGKVNGVTYSNYSSKEIDSNTLEQTKKLLKQLPYPFTPATKDGKNIASTYEVRIDYILEPAIKLARQSVSFPYSQEEEKIKVTARKDWTFTQPANSSLSARKEDGYLVISCKARNERDYDAINDKIIVSTTDNSASYTINISQAGAPRPFIKLEKDKVVIPRDGTPQTITVNSNRTWFVTNTYANSKFTINASSSYLTIEAKKNLSKKGRSVTYGLKTQDGEYSTSLEVYQNGRGDESYGTSGYGRTYENYYERNGKYGLAWANIHLGVGAIVPSFDELYIPVNVEAFTSRLYMVELSLINVRADFSLDGFDGLAWEPHVKFLLPINEKLAIMPYVGPTCQLDIYNIRNSTWNFSAGAVVRYSWGRLAFSDFSIDYHGGPFGGISMGISLGFTSDYAN